MSSITREQVLSSLPADTRRDLGPEPPPPIADFTVSDGRQVTFVALPSDDALEASNLGVQIRTPPNVSPLDALSVAQMTARDIFEAFADHELAVPEELRSHEQSQDRPRGWARHLAGEPQSSLGICSRPGFIATLPSFFWAQSTTGQAGEVIELHIGPRHNPWDWEWNGGGWPASHPGWKRVSTEAHNIDRFFCRIVVCGKGYHAYQDLPGDTLGPWLFSQYRAPGSTTWGNALEVMFPAPTTGATYDWHFWTGYNWDWRTSILHSSLGDVFHEYRAYGIVAVGDA